MKTKWMKRLALGVLTATLISGCFAGVVGAADWDVKPSTTDYYVQLDNSNEIFLCNESKIGTKVGTEYYLTYTVESMAYDKFVNAGVLGCLEPIARWPYVSSEDGKQGGLLQYADEDMLVQQGRTYFYKFTVTEDGYEYRAGWAKGDEAEYMKFPKTAGEVKTKAQHFGVWIATSGMTGKLTRVRCYDKNGNDLGVLVSRGRNATVGRESLMTKDTEVDHRYTIELNDVYNVGLSNKKLPKTDTIYMEYKVKSTNSITYQWGGFLSNAPTANFPYLSGYMKMTSFDTGSPDLDDGPLLVEGAEYLIMLSKVRGRYDVVVQRTYNGETITFSPESSYGEYDEELKYHGLWFAGPKEDGRRMNVVLEDFKCYDSNKNNLGVQFNQTKGVVATHHGELDDYAGCEALYVDEEVATVFALYEDKTMKMTKDGKTETGTFKVRDGVMVSTVDGTDTEYDYSYQVIKDADKKEYWRVHPCKLIFDTNGGSEVETQDLNEENGYMPMEPTDPTLDDNTFEGWFTSDGKEFDFDQLLTKSTTVYAKWSDVEFVSQETGGANVMPYIYGGGAVVILATAGVCGGFIIKRGNNYAEKKKKEN